MTERALTPFRLQLIANAREPSPVTMAMQEHVGRVIPIPALMFNELARGERVALVVGNRYDGSEIVNVFWLRDRTTGADEPLAVAVAVACAELTGYTEGPGGPNAAPIAPPVPFRARRVELRTVAGDAPRWWPITKTIDADALGQLRILVHKDELH